MPRFSLLLVVILLSACSSGAARWDPLAIAPERPALDAAADTNSALDYYAYGVRAMAENPVTAAAAFYWASRLDPTWGDPLYARRAALLVANPQRYVEYLDDDSPIHRSPGVMALDSLMMRAFQLNPFVEPTVELAALNYAIARDVRRQNPGLMDANVDYLVHDWLLGQDPETRAWFAYAERRYADALALYEIAQRDDPDDLSLQADMAQVLFKAGRPDDAVAAMAGVIEAMREHEETELVRVYESKAVFEHFIGLVHETQGEAADARDAYVRALGEDLSYHPAHIRLGDLAFAEGDTATALSELALAVQIRENDPAVRFRYGLLLIQLRRFAEAEPELRRAIELEPLFADPYRLLAVALDFQGRRAEAAPVYREFLERGSRDAAGRDAVNRRLAELDSSAPTTGSTQ